MRTYLIPLFSLIVCLGPAVLAQEVDPNAEFPNVGSRVPILDGIEDPVWLRADNHFVSIHHAGTESDSPEDFSARWRGLWNKEALYILVDVNDDALVQDSPASQGWHDDRIEIFIDADHSRSSTAEGDQVNDFQYNFRWNNGEVETPVEWYFRSTGTSLVGIEYGVATTAKGYLVEAKFPWSTLNGGTPEVGKLVGIEILVGDDDDGGNRDTQIAWITSDGTTHIPSAWGTAILGEPVEFEKAGLISPTNGATDVHGNILLEWTPGEFSDGLSPQHRLFVSPDPNDITNEVGAIEQDEETYPLGAYAFGTTYYWRVDEANSVSGWDEGDVWHFTTEPKAIALNGDLITATASSSGKPEQGPEKTADGSGLANGLHGQDPNTMWISAASAPGEAWIKYQMDQAYELCGLHVWNFNAEAESTLGISIKDAHIEGSLNDTDWVTLANTELTQGPDAPDDPGADVAIPAGLAQQVRLTANSNWSVNGVDRYGLSEVDLLVVPTWARELSPRDGLKNADPFSTVLSWRAGRYAALHRVYVSTDMQAVVEGTATAVDLTETTHMLSLDINKSYYWRVDEVNEAAEPSTWKGRIQSFSTVSNIVVDDMETYKNADGFKIWETWVDGFENDDNGSLVGNGDDGDPETATVQNGAKSLPMLYGLDDNTISEATRTFDEAQNWGAKGIQSLSLYFHGDKDNVAGQLYIKINDTRIDYDGPSADLQKEQWFVWTIDLIDVTAVNSLTLGVEGGNGTVFFDNIRLYPFASQAITPMAPEATGLKVHYALDTDFQDSSGNGNHGTPVDQVTLESDSIRGQVMTLGGSDDGLTVPFVELSPAITVAMWINMVENPLTRQWNSAFHDDGWDANDLHFRVLDGKVDGQVNGLSVVSGDTITQADEWLHIAFTLDSTDTQYISSVWLNGAQEGQTIDPVVPGVERILVSLGGGMVGAWVNADDVIQRELFGSIDDARFYNRALSAGEIAGLAGREGTLYIPFE